MNSIKEQLDHIMTLLEAGDYETAVRRSGEIFAEANERWTADHNGGRDTERPLTELAVSAITHVQALCAAGLMRDAFETATSTIYLVSREAPVNPDARFALIPLGVEAISSFMQTLAMLSQQPDETAREHATVVVSLLASMLFAHYKLYKDVHPDAEPVKAAYQVLDDMIKARLVQSPKLHTPDGEVDPDDVEPVFAELIGRTRALGYFSVE